MGPLDTHRRTFFALTLAALIAGVAVINLLGGSRPDVAPTGPSRPVANAHGTAGNQGALGAAARSARRFGVAYLHYEEGVLGAAERRAIASYSTPQFGGQLLGAPVRVPPGARAPRQWVARVAEVGVGLFDGRPALVATLVIAATDGGHLLRATLTEQGPRWLVAGIGP